MDGRGIFSDNDFDDAGYCPVAADALRYLVAADLWFGKAALDDAALSAYVDSVVHGKPSVTIDPSTEPDWSRVRSKGLAKDTAGDTIVLGGEVQAATPAEIGVLRQFVDDEEHLSSRNVLDVTRDVRKSGGSAGLRRFWILTEDTSIGTRTIVELKEPTTRGTEFGRHSGTLDGPTRFDVLKPYWWKSEDPDDHFTAYVLGGRFVVRDRLIRANLRVKGLTPDQIENVVMADASLLGVKHHAAWGKHAGDAKLTSWLKDSAATLSARWRTAYAAAGGH